MMSIAERLREPFPPERVSWRVGATTADKTKGMALAYIDARDVMDRLDEVVGVDCWQNKYSHAQGKTICDIAIKIGNEWVWKADGAGDSDVEAEKGACSDAFKRAAVRWGVGRYLYDIPSVWVRIVQKGKSYVIDEGEHERLYSVLAGKATAPQARPSEPAPSRPAANGKFTELKDQLAKIQDAASLMTWIEAVKTAINAGQVSTSEKALLQNALEARRAMLGVAG